MAKAFLRKTRETRVRAGHPWIYASEIERVDGEIENGEIIDLYSCKNTFLGRGFYNANSQITIRVLTTQEEEIDEAFFRRRIEDAWNYRRLLCDPMSCRLIHSESDFLSGLVVDKFADVLVMQALSLGIDRRKHMLARLLMEITGAKGVYERSDVPVRRHEGLEQTKGLLLGEVPDLVLMTENGITYGVDVKEGQAVKQGQKVAVLEAMKMENEIQAEADGTVVAILVQKDDSVLEGAEILKLA